MSHLSSSEIRQKFLDYFKKNGHVVVPSSSLIPTDPSVLLTTAGMQQFKKYYTGEADPVKDFGSKNTTSIQKSFRTSDIDEVGDETHLTFFEMLGNFSFSGYFKKEAIGYAHEFITKELNFPISYVTIFSPEGGSASGGKGSSEVPRDEESAGIWKDLGVTDIREEGMHDVFWGPTGTSGPCGPTTEIYCKNVKGEDVEIWNLVFNEFFFPGSREELLAGTSGKKLEPLKQKGVDTGMGFERLAMIIQQKSSIFETDLFTPVFKILPEEMDEKTKRVFADHSRAVCFLISDGVRPSNKEAGYILRRLTRRLIAYQAKVEIEKVLKTIVENYGAFYKKLDIKTILSVFEDENTKFSKTLSTGLKELAKISEVDTKSAFRLYESFGLPYETIKEVSGAKAGKLSREEFDEEFKKHQEISRAGVGKKFGGHGLILNTGELKAVNEEELNKVLCLHTATHLLQRALREVLGPEVKQTGSDITAERTRFDYSFPRKLIPEEIKKVEDLVNEKIKEDLPVNFKEMSKGEAEKTGALFFFKEKYPDMVKVYFVGKDIKSAWSKEFCGGPHVDHTGIIGHFKISKEESIGSGQRRIKGVVSG
ncbi:MAG: alanyl-tRNA synthetase [Parcubacteria group bacterium Gr01-1014_20]|nr:MAG: alanyl-tRNA synthetase [Parcubacteria group bacterium Gr01-1014_20]